MSIFDKLLSEVNDALGSTDGTGNAGSLVQFTNLVRGRTDAESTGRRFRLKVGLSVRSGSILKNAGAFGCYRQGFLVESEVACLRSAESHVRWRRKGRCAIVEISGKPLARIQLSLLFLFAGVGSVLVSWEGEPFCRVCYPIFGPASDQLNDCTGTMEFLRLNKSVKFVINPSVREETVNRTLFKSSDEKIFESFSDEQRCLLVALSLWPWAFYKGGGF